MIDVQELLERIAVLESKVNDTQNKIKILESTVQENIVKVAQLEVQMQILESINSEISAIRDSLIKNTNETMTIKTRIDIYLAVVLGVWAVVGTFMSAFGPKIAAFLIALL